MDTAVLTLKITSSKSCQLFGYFCQQNCDQNVSNLTQSGHTENVSAVPKEASRIFGQFSSNFDRIWFAISKTPRRLKTAKNRICWKHLAKETPISMLPLMGPFTRLNCLRIAGSMVLQWQIVVGAPWVRSSVLIGLCYHKNMATTSVTRCWNKEDVRSYLVH